MSEKSTYFSLNFILNSESSEKDLIEYPERKAFSDITPLSSESLLCLAPINTCAPSSMKDKYYEHLPYNTKNLKPKRKRADNTQTRILEQVFKINSFPSTLDRIQLAERLKMTPRAIQIWFQNKRQALSITRSSAYYGHNAYLGYFKL